MPNTPERILLIAGDVSFRGASILALRLAKGLLERDIDIVMLCTKIGHIDQSLLKGIDILELPGYAQPIWGRVVRQSVLKNLDGRPPDMIHLLSLDMLPQAIWLGTQLSCPVVLSVNDHADASRLLLPSSAQCCRMLVCVSESVQAALPHPCLLYTSPSPRD